MKKFSATATAQTSSSGSLSFPGSGLGNASKDALAISCAFTFSDAMAAVRAIDLRAGSPTCPTSASDLGRIASGPPTLTECEETFSLCAE